MKSASNCSGLSDEQFRALVNSSKKRFSRRLGNLIEEKNNELLKRQSGSRPAINLEKGELVLFAANYVGIVRETTEEFAAELAGAVGRRIGLGNEQLSWVRSQIDEFFKSLILPSALQSLFREFFFSRFTIANRQESEQDLVRLTGQMPLELPSSALTAINSAGAQYPGIKHRRQSRNERESFVRPLLVERGWSINDWSKHANLDFNTANNYLRGKTHPFSSTRKKLAESLGIKPEDLPQ